MTASTIVRAAIPALAAFISASGAAQAGTIAAAYVVPVPERVITQYQLRASGPQAAAIDGSSFSWINQSGASAVAGSPGGLLIAQPAHANATSIAMLAARMVSLPACYSALIQNPANSSLYNGGMALTNAATGRTVVFQDIYANDSQSNIDVVTQTDMFGSGRVWLSAGSYAAYPANSTFFQRVCIDTASGVASFLISPTGLANSFQLLTTVPLAALGSPDQIGLFVDADPVAGQTYAGTLTVGRWQVTPGITPQALAPMGDHSGDFQLNPAPGNGFPVSNILPSIAGDTPKFGLALAAGAANVVDLTFPGSGEASITVPDSASLRRDIYLNFDEGNLNSLIGFPQDSGQGPTAPFYGRARSYPVGDPNDLIPVTARGLKIRARCGGHGRTNCTRDQIRSGFLRLPTPFRPGMTMEIVYRPPTGFSAWVPWWLFTGQQLTPFPNSNAFAPGLNPAGVATHFEIDMNDNFARADYGGCPVGGEVDFGTPDIYGTHWQTAPHMTYAANSNGWSNRTWGNPAVSTTNNYECETGFIPGSTRTMTLNWRADGTNLIDAYIDGKRVASAYMEYPQGQSFTDPDGVVRQLGMTMLIGGQNVPTFDNLRTVVDNDGILQTPTQDAGWTETIYSIKAWTGNLANPDCCDAGANAVK